jgi:predicted RNA-binding Zn ribbon-like protein
VGRQHEEANSGLPEEAEGWLLEFPFRAGRLCLDFLATLGSRSRLNIERLRTAADLLRWFEQAGLGTVALTSEDDLQAALELREAIFTTVTGVPGGTREAIPTINLAALPAPLIPCLNDAGRGRSWATGGTSSAALSTIARDAIDLVSSPLIERVRECAGSDCTLLFLDSSRPGRRRWCAMDVCGNQAKAESLRSKRRQLE